MNHYQQPMGPGYVNGTGMGMGMRMGAGMGFGTSMRSNKYNTATLSQRQDGATDVKGKSRMVELDESNWEAQFAELEKEHETSSERANKASEAELNEAGWLMNPDHWGDLSAVWRDIQAENKSRGATANRADFAQAYSNYANALSEEDHAAWDDFDSSLGLNSTSNSFDRDPTLGDYMFESQNPFLDQADPSISAFEHGVQILADHGNLSLAALAFEAAIQQDPKHVEAWTLLGSAQAQNEKESPAIRAMERALLLDPNNLEALMGLAVSYTNEGYDSTAYRTLERWLSVKYPQIHPPDQVSEPSSLGFADRSHLHERVTELFIRAAQLSPSGQTMDPDVQVGLGVLFYGDEDFDKAVDCFTAALASAETGIANRAGRVHLLWNRLGATLANSGRSEDAVGAYEQALAVNPNFVRARYNLGVSCINIGCYPEAAQHLLGALAMHRVLGDEGLDRARNIVGAGDGAGAAATTTTTTSTTAATAATATAVGSGSSGGGAAIDDEALERMMQQNESSNLYDTLRRAFTCMKRRDLSDRVGPCMSLDAFRGEFDF
jgi:peroxin-5